ncbi:hypothetical protein LINPERHAP1_LOCUS31328 [Linum perenne]
MGGGGGGLSSDQGGGDVQIRDCLVSVTASKGRFGSDFKLSVAKDSSAHFVFLEDAHVKWLERVLNVARDSRWVLPRRCVVDSPRRRIVVARFKARGEPILRISECCANEKVFFVDVPSDGSTGDWSSLLRLVNKVKAAGRHKEAVPVGRSFAEVVGSTGLPTKGRCSVEVVDGEHRFSVSEEGLNERLSFLEKCLVFRFTGEESVVWPDFRRWILRSNELVRRLGEACGDFLDSAGGLDLSSARVKVRLRGAIPRTISVVSGSECFPVCVELEAGTPIPRHDGVRSSLQTGKAKDKGVLISASSKVDDGVWMGGGGFWSTAEFCTGEASGEKREAGFASGMELIVTAGTEERCQWKVADVTGRGFRNREEVSTVCKSYRGMGQRAVFEGFDFGGLRLTPIGLQVGKRVISLEDSFFLNSFVAPSLNLDWLVAAGRIENEDSGLSSSPRNSETPIILGEELVDVPIRFPTSAELVQLGWSSPKAAVTSSLCAVQEAISSVPCLAEVEPTGADERLLCEAVRRVSKVIGLEAEGSTEQGIEAAVRLCKEAIRRRSESASRSRTERELKRLGISSEEAADILRQSRGARCDLSIELANEF